MSKVTLEVCKCCAISEKHIADSVARMRSEHGENLEIIERKCLDVCKEFGAVKLGDEILLVKESDVDALEEKVRTAAK